MRWPWMRRPRIEPGEVLAILSTPSEGGWARAVDSTDREALEAWERTYRGVAGVDAASMERTRIWLGIRELVWHEDIRAAEPRPGTRPLWPLREDPPAPPSAPPPARQRI